MLEEHIKKTRERQLADKVRFETLDTNLCQLCHAFGEDKRSLFISCFYAVHEVLPEAIDLRETSRKENGYMLRICKACRGSFLDMLGKWREKQIYLRSMPKDHDGNIEEGPLQDIPVRVQGAIVMMSLEEFEEYKK